MGAISNKMTMGEEEYSLEYIRDVKWGKGHNVIFFLVVLVLFWKGQKTLCHHSKKLLSI
jgi:hypothetical protein